MGFNPAGTKWSVAAFDDNGALGGFHPTPWEFGHVAIHADGFWAGGYELVPGSDDRYRCEIVDAGVTAIVDAFEVVFVSNRRFVATKNGALYRFGRKL